MLITQKAAVAKHAMTMGAIRRGRPPNPRTSAIAHIPTLTLVHATAICTCFPKSGGQKAGITNLKNAAKDARSSAKRLSRSRQRRGFSGDVFTRTTHEYAKQKKPPIKNAIHANCDSVLTRFLLAAKYPLSSDLL